MPRLRFLLLVAVALAASLSTSAASLQLIAEHDGRRMPVVSVRDGHGVFVVDTNGRTRDTSVEQSTDAQFELSASDAVAGSDKRWNFDQHFVIRRPLQLRVGPWFDPASNLNSPVVRRCLCAPTHQHHSN